MRKSKMVSVPRSALARVIDYLEHDERHHLEDCLMGGYTGRDHVYYPVKRLADAAGIELAAVERPTPEELATAN